MKSFSSDSYQISFTVWICDDELNKTHINETDSFFTFVHEYPSPITKCGFYVLGILILLGAFLFLIKGIGQAWKNWRRYLSAMENIMEITITITIAVGVVWIFESPNAFHQPVAWAVIWASFDVFVLLGTLPSIGIFVHMSLNVLNSMLQFLLVYTPILMGFVTAFYILIPNSSSFYPYPDAILTVKKVSSQGVHGKN